MVTNTIFNLKNSITKSPAAHVVNVHYGTNSIKNSPTEYVYVCVCITVCVITLSTSGGGLESS